MIYYRDAITYGVVLLPLIALLPLAPYYWRHRKRGIVNPVRLLAFYSLVLYVMITWYFVVLPLPSEAYLATIGPAGRNWIPFSYFRDLSTATGFDVMQGSTWFSAVGSNFALQYWFNILMLLPLGMYLRYLFGLKARTAAPIILMTTVFFEVTQLTGVFFWFSKPYRSFDVDDIICNFIGGMLGWWLMGKLTPLAQKIEKRACDAYRRGTRISILRRLIAFAIDAQLVYVLNLLLKMIPGLRIVRDGLYVAPLFLAELFLYTVATTLLMRGRTVGKVLLQIHVCGVDSAPAKPMRIVARYAILYLLLILFALSPALAVHAGLPDTAVTLLSRVLLLLGLAAAVFHVVAAWMFPLRDYPWGVLSGTRVEAQQRPEKARA